MNIEEVQKWIDKINHADANGDYAAAHGLEDSLLWEFIRFMSEYDSASHFPPSAMAKLMLEFLENSESPRGYE